MQIDHDQVQDLVRRVLLPAVIGGAGGGALSAYTSAKAHPEGETPEKRRQRILRNALVGTALGGTAGAAIPTGLNMLTQPYFGAPPASRLDQRAYGHVARNAGGYMAGAAAGGGLWAARNRDRSTAFKHLFNIRPDALKLTNEDQLRDYLSASPTNRSTFINKLLEQQEVGKTELHKATLGLNERLSQAGYKGMSLADMAGHGDLMPRNAWESAEGGKNVLSALKQHLLESSSLPGPLKHFGPSGWMSKLVGMNVGGVSMTPVARRYAEDFLRPSTKMLGGGRMGNLARLGLAGGTALAGKSIWDAATGD